MKEMQTRVSEEAVKMKEMQIEMPEMHIKVFGKRSLNTFTCISLFL